MATKKSPFLLFRFKGFLGVLLLLLLSWGCKVCGVESFTLRIQNINECTGDTPLTLGIYDPSLNSGYQVKLDVTNYLSKISDLSELKPEYNFIRIEKAKIWIDYKRYFEVLPPTTDGRRELSKQGTKVHSGVKFCLEENPCEVRLVSILKPQLASNPTGEDSTTAEKVVFVATNYNLVKEWNEMLALFPDSVHIVPPSTVDRYGKKHFEVDVHVQLVGKNGIGFEYTSNDFVFPLVVCKECLDLTKQTANTPKTICKNTSNPTDLNCLGLDGNCLISAP